jgi:hypothetical protein
MKRFWLVLLSLGLVMAFSASAFAVDVKFSGSYYAAGMYLDKVSLAKGGTSDSQSTAFYFQRLRLQTDFVVSPGLSLITRADIMERSWGAARFSPGSLQATNTASAGTDMWSSGTVAENENIAFDYAYIQYVSPIGIFKVGIQMDGTWGTPFGDYIKGEPGPLPDSRLDNLAGWLDATVDIGIVYFGGSLVYVAGDDPTTTDKKEGGVITGGADFNPALILFNFDRYYWAGPLPGASGTQNPNQNDNPYLATSNAGITNAWLLQGRVGVRPITALDIMASVTWAQVDKKFIAGSSTAVPNGTYGTEVDLTATYKITNNLSYMLGFGYLFTGDYFKGTVANQDVRDDYLVINKLTLTF